jgi:hypothetical protein
MTEPQPPQPQSGEFVFQVPDDLAAGVYSNVARVWHTGMEFTLDFAVTQIAKPVTFEEGEREKVVIPARVVARVKIPPPALFELMQALSKNEKGYEDQFGPIHKPGRPGTDPPLYPPAE